ncbi:ankyrin repeat-containing domain protein [Xylariaceae sp. AK1471]|nr:ankyrin repeat-containing domain protein [Xylariaceae sp. AK1471]
MVLERLKKKLHFRSRQDGRKQRLESKANTSVGEEASFDAPAILDGSSISKPAPIGDQMIQARPPGKSSPPSSEDRGTSIRELWNLAYENLREEDEALIDDYETKLYGDLSAGLSFMPGSKVSMRDRMQAILQHKMQQINRDIWRLKFGSTEVQVRDLVQPVLGVVNWANDYITRAVSANPYASMAWAGVGLLLPLFLNPSEQGTSLANGLEYISSIIVRSWMWEDLYARRYESGTRQQKSSLESHTAYKDALEMLYRQVLKFQATSYCYYASNTTFRLGQDVIKWVEWDKLLDEVKNKESAFAGVSDSWRDMKYDEECLAADERHQEAMRRWQTIGTDISGLREAVLDAQEEKQRSGLLNWLCTVDHSEMYNAARDKHESGTCDWLIRDSKEFKTWEGSPSSLLWLYGKAGSGKSILSSSVVKYLRDRYASDPGSAFAYFFFSFSDQEKQKVVVMLASLVKQLYASRPDTPQPVKSLGEYKEKGERPDIETLEATLIATASGFSSVSIVIDALDECPTLNGERRKLLRSLNRIVSAMPRNLHVFCTSRVEPDISAAMSTVLSLPSRASIDLIANTNHDIGLYIDSVFASADYSLWPDDLKAEAKALLIERADGMFQYIFCQFEALQKLPSRESIHTALQQLPAGLDATYDRLLQSLDTNYLFQILSLLKWLAVSYRDLELEELADTLIIRTDPIVCVDMAERLLKPEICLKYLSSLVITREDDDGCTKVRLAHLSIREYLMSGRIAKGLAARFSFIESDAHLHVALSCLACHLHHSGISEEDVERLQLKKYATQNWMQHLEMVPREIWPRKVVCLAARALAVRSKSLRLILDYDRALPSYPLYPYTDRKSLDWALDRTLERPQSYTARLGYLKLTEMLLYGNFGTNRYMTRWDFDVALENAAYGGKTAVVQSILDRGARVNAQSDRLGNALLAAAYRGHANVVKLLLDNGADVNAQHSKSGSALQVAACRNHFHVVQLLVSRGANVNSLLNEARSAITSAKWSPYDNIAIEILQYLLDPGVSINSQSGTDGTAYKTATYLRDARAQSRLRLLLGRGANGNAQGRELNYLFLQAMRVNSEIDWAQRDRTKIDRAEVELLLDKGADVNSKGGKYGNALQAACYHHRISEGINGSIVELLLDRGADINAQGGEWGTALQAACIRGSQDVVELLLERGADVRNALQTACQYQNLDIARLLLDRGANVNAPGGRYGSALQAAAAAAADYTEMPCKLLELLLSRGADIHEQAGHYGTALQAASRKGDIDRVRLLLDHGAKVNAEGGKYGTALQAACRSGRGAFDVSRLLIEHGADAHLQGGTFGSAWHAAAATNSWVVDNKAVQQLLLDHGVDINDMRGRKHATALQAVLESDYSGSYRDFHCEFTDRVGFLLSRGADVNIKAGTYGFPLQSACANKYKDGSKAVEFLLQNCPDIHVNASGGMFGSALQAAAYSGQTSSVKLLLDKGAHINTHGGKYGSALNAAIFKGFWDIVEVLLERGAKPDRQQLPSPDEEWLSRIQEEDGEEPVARYRVFWEKQAVSEGVV